MIIHFYQNLKLVSVLSCHFNWLLTQYLYLCLYYVVDFSGL